MISIWYANAGEDFRIQKFPKEMVIVTTDNTEISLSKMTQEDVHIVGHDNNYVYVVYSGRRILLSGEEAINISGLITGKTKQAPKIHHAAGTCTHCCSKCKGCCHT